MGPILFTADKDVFLRALETFVRRRKYTTGLIENSEDRKPV